MRPLRPLFAVLASAVVSMGAATECKKVPPTPVFGQVIDIPSAAEPAETPGTPGVVASNPKILTQFGGSPDLNLARYTRWRLNGVEQPADAILVVIAGFGGGVNNYALMAEDLIAKMNDEYGLVLEVWGYHRRSNKLEDRRGFYAAQLFNDPLMAMDWYYGNELYGTDDVAPADGIPDSLGPILAGGFGGRAQFYNTSDDIPFIANWTPQVHSIDLDAVVEAALAHVGNGNVFLAGHSAGTGFAARYAATDFDLTGAGPAEPGHARLRGLVLLEGGGGSTLGTALSEDSLDRIIAKADGGNFGAVRDQAGRCVDGTTACTLADEATTCAGQTPPVCTPPATAYSGLLGGPGLLAASEPLALQAQLAADPDAVLAIPQQPLGPMGEKATDVVPDLGVLGILPPGSPYFLFGQFLDDDGLAASFLSPAVATGLGGPGVAVGGLNTWLTIAEGPFAPSIVPNNGPKPTAFGGNLRWGQEIEVVEMKRFLKTFTTADSNAADWYYPTSGLSTTSAPGFCDTGTSLCTKGNVGAACAADGDCGQSISLDSSALSLPSPAGRGRPDIANLTQAGAIDIPVLCIGGSNGLTPVPGIYTNFGLSIGTCTAASCDGSTARVVDAVTPNEAFPTFGNVAGGYEVYVFEGLAHNDVLVSEDSLITPLPAPDGRTLLTTLADFIDRNSL